MIPAKTMKPRREKSLKEKNVQPQEEKAEADLEKFIQTFEKPTKIYRYLRTRHLVSPIFLQRTLHYMKHRRSVSNALRKTFKVDDILEKLEKKADVKQEQNGMKLGKKYVRLEFIGFYDNSCANELREVEVEVVLARLHPNRKHGSVQQSSLGKIMIPVNGHGSQARPQSSLDGTQADAGDPCGPVIVSREGLDLSHKESVRSTTLRLCVTCHQSRGLANGLCNGEHVESDEPQTKRRKSAVNGKSLPTLEADSPGAGGTTSPLVYSTELSLYGRHDTCMLKNGEYDMLLQRQPARPPPRTEPTYEDAYGKRPMNFGAALASLPSLKFKLLWTDDCEGQVPCKVPPTEFLVNNHYPGLHHYTGLNVESSPPVKIKEEGQSTPQKKTLVTYQFLYNENTRQQTDTRDNLACPWCSLNCGRLYSLLKHLRLSHARFNIIYVPLPKGARIDVSLNDCYDGSYSGNPQDLNSHIGYAFSRLGPVRRTPATHVIVYRPKRPSEYLVEFCEPEKENQVSRQIIQGHNRLYYRTNTCLPLKPQEIDQDSEDEISPKWLQQKSVNLIDEFTDVNEGEKELMKLWNLHCMKYDYMSDCQMPAACQKFVEEQGRRVLELGIVKNFTVHLVNMFDFSLVTPDIVQRTMWQLHMLQQEMDM